MTVFLIGDDLAEYLGVSPSATLDRVVDLTNDLVADAWNPDGTVTLVQATAIAWSVAVRAGANPKGLTSWTRNWDDISRTERMEVAGKVGVYLSDEERTMLAGVPAVPIRRAKTIRLDVPGWRR